MTLFNYLASPEINFHELRLQERVHLVFEAPCFVGAGVTATGWTKILEDMTTVPRLDFLSSLPLGGRIAIQGTIHQQKRWCPLCLQDGIKNGKPYGQFIWELEPVVACPKHRILLHHQCRCGKLPRIMGETPKLLPHLCKHCGRALAPPDPDSIVEASCSAVRRAAAVGELLCSNLFLGNTQAKSNKKVSDFLRAALSTWQTLTLSKVADQIGRSKSDLSYWKNGVHPPLLCAVVLIAEAFNCSLESVLTGDVTRAQEPIFIEPNPKARKDNPVSTKEITRLLKIYSEDTTRLSLTEIGKQLGIDRSTIRKQFPKIAIRLVANRNRIRKEITTKIHLERAKAYQMAAKTLALEGLRPTQRRIWEFFGPKHGFFHPIDRESCRRACQEAILSTRKIS
jgi:transcriptional regulator with XRE-family HTH domain